MSAAITLSHVRVRLALHPLKPGGAPNLLLLHGLGERTPDRLPAFLDGWAGAVYGLDFVGHGQSEVPAGGGYTSEVLMGDADAALAHIGPATVLGRGLGAYIALLLAGARPELVRGAVLADGPGLAGGGPSPGSPYVGSPVGAGGKTPDPFALLELSRDLRPPDYATSFARQATSLSDLAHPITVSALVHPDWLAAVVAEPGVQEASLERALDHYASV
jgi:pimeloyl-ACP methyl ester carboxylesterase